jgi:cob(I)alamin adenosyltransferase
MARLTKIYTQTGDQGETGLVAGKRVSKDSPRIWAAGTVDELNSAIGLARALKPDQRTAVELAKIQNNLFNLGAELATLPEDFATGMPSVKQNHIAALERLMDELNAKLGPLAEFILPGGTPAAAQLHVARTVCRRAERWSVRLARQEKIGTWIVPYLNRLGDALFVLARWENFKAAVPETSWRKPALSCRQASRRNARRVR